MRRTSPPLSLFGLVTITGALVFGFHRVGDIAQYSVEWSDPVGWAAGAAPEQVVATAVRYAGLGIGYWVLATTAVYAIAGLFAEERRPRWVAMLTTPAIRRIVDRALATALTASIAANPLGPALAAEAPEPIVFEWGDGIPAQVPGSVHAALVQAGRLPDPTFGTNQKAARQESLKTWWFRRTFAWAAGGDGERLTFGGVCNRCTVWLNDQELGSHEGMFGGPDFDVSNLLQDENVLVVRLDPAPYMEGPGPLNDFFIGMNVGWVNTVVFNNVYGWHYSNLPSLGIWRSVEVRGAPTVSLGNPFVATPGARDGLVDLTLHLEGQHTGWSGTLHGTIAPETFDGDPFCFQREVHADQASV